VLRLVVRANARRDHRWRFRPLGGTLPAVTRRLGIGSVADGRARDASDVGLLLVLRQGLLLLD
jgi:hypothetical protein